MSRRPNPRADLLRQAVADEAARIMNEQGVRVSTYGPGDLEGLARIGSIDC